MTVSSGENLLSNYRSKAVSVDDFVAYCACRRTFLEKALVFYGGVEHP